MPSLNGLLWALPWILLALAAPFIFTRKPRLRDCKPMPPQNAPLVSVIVPARNERLNIGACVGSLLQSRYANIEVIVVDDDSTDGTGHIARNMAERDERLRVLDGQPLPAGWLGKCWACWQGYTHARGELLLFTDADTRHEPDLLARAVGALHSAPADLVSVIPRQLMDTFWERVILPHIFIALAMRYPDLARVNRSRNPRNAIANGQFILIRRDAYVAIGGHEAVRTEIVEDLRLAQSIVGNGRRLFLAHAEDLMRTRMYRSFAEIVEGWSKNLATGARQSVDPWLRPFIPWILGAAVALFWAAPAAAFIAGALGFLGGPAFEWAMIASLASLAFWTGALRRFRAPLRYAFAFPLGGAVAGLLFLRSGLSGRRISWKGRTYEPHPNTSSTAPPPSEPERGGRDST